MRLLKYFWHTRFTAEETQKLILAGWVVAGDRRSAVRDGETIYP